MNERRPICHYCLADLGFTPLGAWDKPKCPVCASAYDGPPRTEEFEKLKEAGLTIPNLVITRQRHS